MNCVTLAQGRSGVFILVAIMHEQKASCRKTAALMRRRADLITLSRKWKWRRNAPKWTGFPAANSVPVDCRFVGDARQMSASPPARPGRPLRATDLKQLLPLLEPTRYDSTLAKFRNYHELWK
jgi:hypothetical protein